MSGSASGARAVAEGRPLPADEPLGLSVHSLPAPGAALARQRARGRWQTLVVLLVCAAPVVASYLAYYVIRPGSPAAAYGTLIDPPQAMPDAVGRTLDGQPQRLRDAVGQWLLVVVDGGGCAAACEKRLFLQRQLREMLGRDRDRVDKLWLVVDAAEPAAALRDALAATPAMTVLRLPRAKVEGWLEPAAGRSLEDHLYIVDPLGNWMLREPPDADPSRVKRDLDRLLRASAGWDQPGHQRPIDTPPGQPSPAARN